MDRYIAQHGPDDGYHITVQRDAFDDGFYITIWKGNHGATGLGVIRDKAKSERMAKFLYDELLPEYEAERIRQRERSAKIHAEMEARPKPKPPKIPKNAPKVDVLECSECNALMLPDEVSDERVYECSTCGAKGTGDDGRRCESVS